MKRLWSLLLVLLLIPCLVVAASAEETSGTCGNDLTWVYDSADNTLTVSGEGNMYDYTSLDEIPWGTDVQTLVIEEGVTAIGEKAFMKCSALETVSLPGSLAEIGAYAFWECTSLRSIALPEGITVLEQGIFNSCTALQQISIPGSVTSIETFALAQCALEKVVLPEGLTELGYYAFGGNGSLTEVSLPASLKYVGESAFRSCKLLDTVVYAGTMADRDHIVFERNNGEIFAAPWQCADGTLEAQFAPIVIIGQLREENGKPVLYWDRPLNPVDKLYNIINYRIYRSEKATSGFKLLAEHSSRSTSPTYTDKTAEVGKTYYYKIKATTGESGLMSDFSNTVNVICRLRTPVSSVSVNEETGIAEVEWNTVSGAEKYFIYRSTSMYGTYKRIGTAIKARVFKDTDAKIGKVYYYKVKAIHENPEANSFSSVATWGMRRLRTPTIKVTLTDSGDPKVTWNTIKGAEKYYIYRSTSEDGTYTKVKTAVEARSFVDKKAKSGTRYYYTVRAIDDGGGHSEYALAKSVRAK